VKAGRRIARSGPRSALDGLPVGLKDVIDIAGHPTTCHSAHSAGQSGKRRCGGGRQAAGGGAIFPAKLATHGIRHWRPGLRPALPTRAQPPGNTAHHPGGSSSGSGAAVGANILPAALGTDTGGPVRHPASHCGIVGMKATSGLVSRRGVFPLAFTLDHVGPTTRTVADNALLLGVMAEPVDALDPGSAAHRPENYCAADEEGLRGLTIGYVRAFP
jgi:aspartyl-tRNA(Asn)/glutamyl-tRNA(Gln) amidotransferase subunit A